MQHVTQHVTHAIAQRLGTSPDATFRKTLTWLEGTILADDHKGKNRCHPHEILMNSSLNLINQPGFMNLASTVKSLSHVTWIDLSGENLFQCCDRDPIRPWCAAHQIEIWTNFAGICWRFKSHWTNKPECKTILVRQWMLIIAPLSPTPKQKMIAYDN